MENGNKQILYHSSIHANEWINTPILMKFVELLCKGYVNNSKVSNINPKLVFDNVSLYIVPMVNSDGVDLVNGYFDEDSEIFINAKKISANFPDIPFPSGWKANIVGTDLNLQFPARME